MRHFEARGVVVHFEDATPAALAAVIGDREAVVVANLPYGVGTTLLLDLLQTVPGVGRPVVMVQREVADRLAAPPGSRTSGGSPRWSPPCAARCRSSSGCRPPCSSPRPRWSRRWSS